MVFQSQGESLPDIDSWQEASPLLRASRLPAGGPTRLYLFCGRRDEYGFSEASEKIAATARSRGFEVTWVPLSGGHPAHDDASLARFLSDGHRRLRPDP